MRIKFPEAIMTGEGEGPFHA